MEATEIRSARPMPEMILRITETGREITDTPEAPANRVDLADIRAWRFFRASPAEFLEQYGRDFCIDHIHAAFEVLTEAVKHLDLWHTRSLTLSGHIGSRRLTALRKTCDQRGIRLTVTYLTAPRALTFDTADASLRHAGSCGTALLTAGIGSDSPLRATPSVYWSAWFHRFFYDEVLPVLRVRDPGTFFSYLKVLSDYTARGMNWAGIGTRCGISGPCARDWCRFLVDCGVVELVEAASAPAPRRAKMRPKLFWNTPGLAVWFSDTAGHLTPELKNALIENCVYLALKDAFPGAAFSHFLDTNAVTCPLMMKKPGENFTAFYFPKDALEAQTALRYHKSIVKAGIAGGTPRVVFEGDAAPADIAPIAVPGAVQCLHILPLLQVSPTVSSSVPSNT